MALVAALVPDLMLSSRVSESLRAAGHEVSVASWSAEWSPPEGVGLIVCDLETVDPVAVAAFAAPSLGFYSHVDVATRSRAQDAGIDLVVPRSRMARELPELAARLLG
jgi:hypothetical protein